MINRIISVITLLFVAVVAYEQDISKHQCDSLTGLLRKDIPDTTRINATLTLARYQIFKPGENKTDLDSAASFIATAIQLNKKIKSVELDGYATLVNAYLTKERGQTEAARQLVEKAIQVLISENEKKHLGEAYYELSGYYNLADDIEFPQKIILVQKAVSAFQASGDIERQAATLKMLGDLYGMGGDYPKAISTLMLSGNAYKSIQYTHLQSLYALTGKIYRGMANYDQALNYELMALKTAEAVKDTSIQLCEINNVLGIIYKELGKNELAISYYKAAMASAQKYNDSYSVAILLYAISYTYAQINKPQEALDFLSSVPKKYLHPDDPSQDVRISMAYIKIYSASKEYAKATQYCDHLVYLVNHKDLLDYDLNDIYRVVAGFYFQTKQYSLARKYLARNKSISEHLGQPLRKVYDSNLWFRIDSAQGNFESAMNYLLIAKNINDSLFTATKARQLQQLGVQFETEKKEDSIKLKNKDLVVLNQKYQLQQSNLKQANLVKNVTFTGIAVLFIIIGLLYKQYRNKQQSNQVITHKNELLEHLVREKEWLLKEVHHRVKNNLHTVICLLESQAAYLEDDALKANEISQHRIYAMSLIHQKLYQSEDVKTIDMAAYLPDFIRYLDESFGVHYKVSFQLDIEPLKLGVSQAIPIALIINEAVTNSIKYAFPQNRKGIIEITMHQMDDQIILTIADNGIGIDSDLAKTPSDSLGLKLIKGLSEDINASIDIKNDNGTKIIIVFNVDPLNESDSIPNTTKEKGVYT